MQSTTYPYEILMKLLHSQHIYKKYTNTKFHENPSSGIQVVPCRQARLTDRHDEANSIISKFCERVYLRT